MPISMAAVLGLRTSGRDAETARVGGSEEPEGGQLQWTS